MFDFFFVFFCLRNGFFTREDKRLLFLKNASKSSFLRSGCSLRSTTTTRTHSEEEDKREEKWTRWRRRNVSSANSERLCLLTLLCLLLLLLLVLLIKSLKPESNSLWRRFCLRRRLATFTTQKMTSTTLSTQTRKNWKRLKLWLSFSTSAHPSTLTRTRSMRAWKMSQTPRLKCLQ